MAKTSLFRFFLVDFVDKKKVYMEKGEGAVVWLKDLLG